MPVNLGKQSLGHRLGLDGLRGIAIVLVMLSHTGLLAFNSAGAVGVAVFFTLSGFLITTLLLDERSATGRIRLGQFYRRRVLRLIPALVVFLAVTLALGSRFATGREVVQALLFVLNWPIALRGNPGGLGHLWSLSVEEQFYLAWPLIMVAATRIGVRRLLLPLALLGLIASLAQRVLLWDGTFAGAVRVYYGTDTSAMALLVGCALALAIHGRTIRRVHPVVVSGALIGVAVCALAGSVTLLRLLIAPTVAPFLVAVVILGICSGTVPAYMTPGWLLLVGRRSYGLYLWQEPVVVLLAPAYAHVPMLVVAPVYFAISWLLAVVSWHVVEARFLALKNRGTGRERTGPTHRRTAPFGA